jgi:hypothetical protein
MQELLDLRLLLLHMHARPGFKDGCVVQGTFPRLHGVPESLLDYLGMKGMASNVRAPLLVVHACACFKEPLQRVQLT